MKNIFDYSPNESLGFLVARIYALRQKKMNEELASIGLNYVQYNLLIGLYWLQLNGETVNQISLIHFTKLDKSVVSNILRKMEKEGYLLRTEDKEDTRAKILSFTPKGEELANQAVQIVNRIDSTFWGEIPQKTVCEYLNQVIDKSH